MKSKNLPHRKKKVEKRDLMEQPISLETCRFLVCGLPLHTTSSIIKTKLEKEGFTVQFANIKFCHFKNYWPNSTGLYYKSDIVPIEKCEGSTDFKCQCYVKIVYPSKSFLSIKTKLEIPSIFGYSTSVTILPDQSLSSSTKIRQYQWYPDLMKQILCHFSSPPKLVPKEHRDNSYNLLAFDMMSKYRYSFNAFKDHLYFSKLLIRIHPSNFFKIDSK